MADPIVQTIKVEVEGADQAAAAIKKVGDSATQSFEDMQNAANAGGAAVGSGLDQTSKALDGTSKALDETAKKSGITSKEMRALGKVMATFGGGDIAHAALGITKVGAALGALGAAAIGVGLAVKALLDFGKAAKEVTEGSEKLSKLTANTPQQMEQLATAFIKGGASAKSFFESMEKASLELTKFGKTQNLWPEQIKSMEEAANAADRLQAKIRDAVSNTGKNVAKVNVDVLTSAKSLGEAVFAEFSRIPGAFKNGEPDMVKFAEFLNRAFNGLNRIGQVRLTEFTKSLGIPDDVIKSISKTTEEYDKLIQKAEHPSLKDRFLKEASNNLEKFIKQLQNAATIVGSVLVKSFDDISIGLAIKLGEATNAVESFFASILEGAAKAAQALGKAEWAASLRQAAAQMRSEVDESNKHIQDLKNSLDQTGAAGAQAAQTSVQGFKTWDDLVKDVTVNSKGFKAEVEQPIKPQIDTSQATSTFDAFIQKVTAWVTTAPGDAWKWVVDTYNSAMSSIQTATNETKSFIEAWVTTPVANAWQWIKDKFNSVLQSLGFGGGGTPAPAGGGVSANASGGLIGGRGTGTSDSNLAWVSRGEYIVPADKVQQPGVLQFLESLRLARFAGGGLIGSGSGGQAGEDAQNAIQNAINDVIQQVGNAAIKTLEPLRTDLGHIMDKLQQSLQEIFHATDNALFDAFVKHAQALSQVFNFGFQNNTRTTQNNAGTQDKSGQLGLFDFQYPGLANWFAGGGLIGGHGSGTSDSNLSWVSRGEHIMPARAVAQPGVLAFLEGLRRSGGNLRAVLDGMGRFALGGMVRAPLSIPAFAGGGMNHVTINFPGLPEITGLRASSGVVDELRRAAALSQVRSGGRKPSRYS